MAGVRIPCEYCPKAFCNKKTLSSHYRSFIVLRKISNFKIVTYLEIK